MSEKLKITLIVVLIVVAIIAVLLAVLIPIILVVTEKWFVYPKFSYEFLDDGDV